MPDPYVKQNAYPSGPHLQLPSSSPQSGPRHFWTHFLSLNISRISMVPSTALPPQSLSSPTFMVPWHDYQPWRSVHLSQGMISQALLAICHRTWWQRKCMSCSLLVNPVLGNSLLCQSLHPLSLLSPLLKAGFTWVWKILRIQTPFFKLSFLTSSETHGNFWLQWWILFEIFWFHLF